MSSTLNDGSAHSGLFPHPRSRLAHFNYSRYSASQIGDALDARTPSAWLRAFGPFEGSWFHGGRSEISA